MPYSLQRRLRWGFISELNIIVDNPDSKLLNIMYFFNPVDQAIQWKIGSHVVFSDRTRAKTQLVPSSLKFFFTDAVLFAFFNRCCSRLFSEVLQLWKFDQIGSLFSQTNQLWMLEQHLVNKAEGSSNPEDEAHFLFPCG